MGIPGLLRVLQPYCETVHISQYAGQRVGIDGHSWLHKGGKAYLDLISWAYASSQQASEKDSGAQTGGDGRSKGWRRSAAVPLYVTYFLHRVNMFKFHNVTPVVVFDGGRLPMKAGTDQERRQRREACLAQAKQKLGRGESNGVKELFQRALDVTCEMANTVILALQAEGVEFEVAPYEADAQLAWLATGEGLGDSAVSAVVSEDSDLLAYGCPKVMYKMDRFGNGEQLRLEKMFSSPPPPGAEISLQGFNQDLFLGMCVLAGCDFLPSIPGIGIKRAHGAVAKFRSISRALTRIKYELKSGYPSGYEERFWKARATFLHARVYDSSVGALRYLTPMAVESMSKFGDDDDFLGPYCRHCRLYHESVAASVRRKGARDWLLHKDLPPSVAKGVAEGRLNPVTHLAFQSRDDTCQLPEVPSGCGGAEEEEGVGVVEDQRTLRKDGREECGGTEVTPARVDLSAFATATFKQKASNRPLSRPSSLHHSLLWRQRESDVEELGVKSCTDPDRDGCSGSLGPPAFKKMKVEGRSVVGVEVGKSNWLQRLGARKMAQSKQAP